jgi:uncharacterized protein YdaU (DUF1376 family)
MSYAYYRFFTGDYMRDTMHLGWFEDLAYRRLIDLYLLHGKPLRNDRAYILRAVRASEPEQQAAVDLVLSEFFVLKADGWHQARCDAEMRWRSGISEQGKRAVKAREERKRNNTIQTDDDPQMIARSSNQNQNQNQNTPKSTPSCASYDARFLEFWSHYPRKKSKGQAWKAWQRLRPNADLEQQIADGLNRAKSSPDWKRDNGKFIPHPATWLNARGWEDEVAAEESRMGKFVV